jgi:broad specificity phosphatase PhoE
MCGHTDIPLAENGRVQAHWLARRLQHEHIAAIYSSDLSRARETATIIATKQAPAIPVHISPAWRELAFGDWEGLTYTAIAEQFTDQLGFFTDPEHIVPPGGESLAQALQRVQPALAALLTTQPNQGSTVIVSHGGLLRALLCRILGLTLDKQWRLRLAPGSLSSLDMFPRTEETSDTPAGILTLLNEQRPARTKEE